MTVDAELRVGSLEETITVTGEAPIVDVRSSTQQRVLNSDVIDALPSARNYFGLGAHDARNTHGRRQRRRRLADSGRRPSVTVHGSRNVDQRVTVNGVNTMTLQAGGNIGGQTPDVGSAAEVDGRHQLAVGRPADRRRAHQLRAQGRRQQVLQLDVPNFTNESLQGDNFSRRAAGRRADHAEP